MGSQEQARGIEQIGLAVGQMEKVTQRNAANPEESAAASEELAAQARTLQETVEILERISGAGSRSSGGSPGRSPSNRPAAAVARQARPPAAHNREAFPLDDMESAPHEAA
jgi:hypothetical protein